MVHHDLGNRTQAFAIRIIKLSSALPANRIGDVLGRQILKSGTSIGANWREAMRASSKNHFVTTTEICIREAEGTRYWLDLLTAADIVKANRLSALHDECSQLIAILTSTVKRAEISLRKSNQPS